MSCGEIKYEPQSVEGPKGLTSCNGGNAQFAELNDNNKGWNAAPVGRSVTFTWTFTARHSTASYDYYIGSEKIASVPGNNQQPLLPPFRTRWIWVATQDARRYWRSGTSRTRRTRSTPASTCR